MPPEYVETTATGVTHATPDVAVVTVRIEAVADSVAAALDSCAGLVTGAVEALDATTFEHTRQTGRVAIATHWDQARGVEHGFEASQSLAVRLTDTEAVGEALTALSEAVGDALRVDRLAWTYSDTEVLHSDARKAAFRSARAKAEQLAALGGRVLGPLLRVREGSGSEISTRGSAEMGVMSVRTDKAMSMPVDPGHSEVETTVTCRWLLAD